LAGVASAVAVFLAGVRDQAYRFAHPDMKGLKISFGTPTVFCEDLHR
jgi:hypothetical protein